MKPNYALQPYAQQDLRIVDNGLIGEDIYHLPNVCTFCGCPTHQADQRLSKINVQSSLPLIGLVLGGLLGWLIAYYLTKRSVEVHHSVCPDCLEKQRIKRLTMAGGLTGIGAITLGGLLAPEFFFVGMVSLTVFLLGMTFWRKSPLRVSRKNSFTYLTGIHPNAIRILKAEEAQRYLPAPYQTQGHGAPFMPHQTHAPTFQSNHPPAHPPQHDGTDGSL